MTTAQLSSQTPNGYEGMTLCLSEDTRVIAHAARQYKAGYVTISRFSADSSKWRNVHISKKAFEKFKEHSSELLKALLNGHSAQVRLANRQFAMITKFERMDKGTIYHLSLLHPKTDQEVLVDHEDCMHSKTINLRKEEFQKLQEAMSKLHETIITPPKETARAAKAEEVATVQAYQWNVEKRGMMSHTLYPTREECEQSVKLYLQGLPTEEKYEFDIIEIRVNRSSKMEILEHVFCGVVLDKTGYSWSDLMMMAPSQESVDEALRKVTKNDVVQIAEQIAVKLNHKRLYFMSDIFDIFVYFGGVDRARQNLANSTVNPPEKLSDRLLEFCYRKIVASTQSTPEL